MSTIFEPKHGKSGRKSYNWAKITIEYLKNKESIVCGKAEAVANKKPLKWLTIQKLDGNDVFIPIGGHETEKEGIEVENVGTNAARQLNFPFLLEWNKEYRQMLIGDEFRKYIEIDELSSSHAAAFVDLSKLLYPGVTRIRDAYVVKKFSDEKVRVDKNIG
ncbi:hypothetical protein ACTXT7_009037 [Hymenolepis weldensis]